MKLSKLHCKIYGEKLVELADMAIIALVLGQFLSKEEFAPEIAGLGLIFSFLCYLTSYMFLKEVKSS
jgi:hypothetical protein